MWSTKKRHRLHGEALMEYMTERVGRPQLTTQTGAGKPHPGADPDSDEESKKRIQTMAA